KNARRKKIFFTGPPLSKSQKEHVATRFHVRYQDLAKAACPDSGSSSVLILNQDAIFSLRDC
ncbi:MAG TPA: hypothetical protein VN223_01110, partial [Candidatus Elarobacter sp.]|nr:hypothetical protein [Candidatus Elarobacter sp.]